MTTDADQLLCGICSDELGDAVPSRIYNAAFDTTSKVHTECLGGMIVLATNDQLVRRLRAENPDAPECPNCAARRMRDRDSSRRRRMVGGGVAGQVAAERWGTNA